MHYGSLNLTISNAASPVVRVSGELDAESSGFFETTLREALGRRACTFNLDLADLSFADSIGLHALVTIAIEAGNLGRKLNISSMSAHVDHMLTLAGFRHFFTILGAPQELPNATPPRQLGDPTSSFEVPKGIGSCRIARDQVYSFAAKMGFEAMALEDIKLAIGEAVSNAIRHGAITCENVRLHCENSRGRLVVTITYPSAEFDPSAVPIPTYSTAAEGGMGIYFMKLVMDRVNYEFQEGSTVLTLEKKLA